jgi:hypothetical protein
MQGVIETSEVVVVQVEYVEPYSRLNTFRKAFYHPHPDLERNRKIGCNDVSSQATTRNRIYLRLVLEGIKNKDDETN